MKKLLNPLMIALAAIATLATTCGPKEPDPAGPLPLSSPHQYVINAINVIDGNSSIATVKAFMDVYEASGEDEVIATGEYKNDGFKLALPRRVSDNFLYKAIEEFEYDNRITVSNHDAKMGGPWLYAFSSSDKEMGELYCFGVNNKIYANAFYIYADRDFTIKGKIYQWEWSMEYDCSFKKGWNIVYSVEERYGYNFTVTTQKPANLVMNWLFDEDYYWNAPYVRFKKEGAYENCQAIAITKEYGWEVCEYFGSGAGLSSYYRIIAGHYDIMYYDDYYWNRVIFDYNFEGEGMYTVVCSDNDGELYFYVTKDSGNKFSKSKNLLKNRRPLSPHQFAVSSPPPR